MTLVVGGAVAFICAIKYATVIYNSNEKWFHVLILAMVAFAGLQMHQFYLNQKEIDAKMEALRLQ